MISFLGSSAAALCLLENTSFVKSKIGPFL